MKLAILSRSARCYSTRRLRDSAAKRGHTVKVLDTLKFAIDLQPGEPDLYYRGKRLTHYDAILPRIGASITYFGTAVVRQFEQMDVFTANSSVGISNSRDKLRSLQVISRHKIGIPATTFVKDRADVLPAIERVGGAPVIIKLLEGTQGIGVILADSVKIADAIIETLQSTKQNVLLQKFVAESKGRDIRALVVGDRVVAAMRRTAKDSEFRSNVHRGGTVEPVVLDETYAETAVRAAQILGLRLAGVALLTGTELLEHAFRIVGQLRQDPVPRGLERGFGARVLRPFRKFGRDEPLEEDEADGADQEAARRAEDEAQRAVDGADTRIEDEVRDLHRDQRDDDQGHEENAGDRRDERDHVVGDVVLRVGHRERMQRPRRDARRHPGDDGQHLSGEAAHHREQSGNQDDAEDDQVEDRYRHGLVGPWGEEEARRTVRRAPICGPINEVFARVIIGRRGRPRPMSRVRACDDARHAPRSCRRGRRYATRDARRAHCHPPFRRGTRG